MFFSQFVIAQKASDVQEFTKIDKEPFADNTHHWYDIFDKHNVINPLPGRPQYKPTEIRNIADNILLFQKNNGGWPKNYDFFAILTPEQKEALDSVSAEIRANKQKRIKENRKERIGTQADSPTLPPKQ